MRTISLNKPQARLMALAGGILGLLLIVAGFMGPATTNGITIVSPTIGSSNDNNITPDKLKPAACGPQQLDILVAGNGTATVTGSAANSLVLSDSATETIQGGPGNECLVGGALTQTIISGGGTDVCIGPLTANYVGCVRTPE
jgi:Ca2+-binding RTX toxin-like protein